MKFYGQEKIIPLETSFPTLRTLQNMSDLFNRSAHSGSPAYQWSLLREKKPSIAYPADGCSLCHTDHFLTRQSDELEDPVLSQYYKSPQPEQLLRPYPHHLKTEYMSSTIPSWYRFSQHQSPQPAHSSIPST